MKRRSGLTDRKGWREEKREERGNDREHEKETERERGNMPRGKEKSGERVMQSSSCRRFAKCSVMVWGDCSAPWCVCVCVFV